MAEGQSMTTVADVVAQVLGGEHGDFVREAVALVARELMEAEISAEVGAELGEVSEARSTHRNGYRPRAWETRVGEIELLVPRKRSGAAYFPSLLGAAAAVGAGDRRGRAGGLRQRRLDPEGRSAGRAARDPGDDQGPRLGAVPRPGRAGRAVPQRPLEGAYPYLWLDAKHVKVRDHGRVVSKALVVAYAVHETGRREVIGLDVGEVESGRSGSSSSAR